MMIKYLRALVNHDGAFEEVFVGVPDERFCDHSELCLEIQGRCLQKELEGHAGINRSHLGLAYDIVDLHGIATTYREIASRIHLLDAVNELFDWEYHSDTVLRVIHAHVSIDH